MIDRFTTERSAFRFFTPGRVLAATVRMDRSSSNGVRGLDLLDKLRARSPPTLFNELAKLSADWLLESGDELPRRSFERPGERIFTEKNAIDQIRSIGLGLRRGQDEERSSRCPTVRTRCVRKMLECRLSYFRCRRFV